MRIDLMTCHTQGEVPMQTRTIASVTAFALLFTIACADSPDPLAAPGGQAPIKNGTPTGSAFGAVGALMYDFNGNGLVDGDDLLCTGSLVSPTVFVTAAHCVVWLPADAQLQVTFEPSLVPAPATFIAATGFAFDPLFGHDQAHPHDLAVVFLPAGSTTGITPYHLPPAGYLDQLADAGSLKKAVFVNVGYGASSNRTGRPTFGYDGLRNQSESLFRTLTPAWLGLRMNAAATGYGGDCYGDSGGPKFLASDPTTVVATVVTGDAICRATSWDYRLDTDVARGFLSSFVTLP
jgi:hypothetical protein